MDGGQNEVGSAGASRPAVGASPTPAWFVRRPLIGLALAFVAGSLLGLRYPAAPSALFRLAAAGWLVAALFSAIGDRAGSRAATAGKPGLLRAASRWAIFAAVLSAAWFAASLHVNRRAGTVRALDRRSVEVTGVVAADADVRPRPGGEPSVEFPLRAETVRDRVSGQAIAFDGRVEVSCLGWRGGTAPRYGERWRVAGRLAPCGRAPASLLPPAPSGLVLYTRPWGARFESRGHGLAILDRAFAARRAAARQLQAGIADQPLVTGVLRALLLGHREALDAELRDAFVASGTLHIFAISGLHVALLAGMLIVVVGALRVPRPLWIAFLAPVLIGYTAVTGARSSAVRACVMAVVYWAAPAFGRRPDVLTALAASALLILAADPAQIRDAGFVLSFGVVIGLMAMTPLLMSPVRRWCRADPFRIEPESAPVRGLRAAALQAGSLAAVSVAAWLSSAPLTGWYFGRLTPVALVANLFVVPVSLLVTLSGCLALVFGPAAGFLAEVFNNANVALVLLMVRGAQALSRVPGGNWVLPELPVWAGVLWYVVLGLACYAAWAKGWGGRSEPSPGGPP